MRRRRKNRKRKEFKCTRYVLLKDVPTKSSKEEYVGDMVQRHIVTTKDVPMKSTEEEYALGMVQSQRLADTKDVPVLVRKGEFVSNMVQSKNAVMMSVPTLSSRVEFVSNMVQRKWPRLAVTKDVPITSRIGEFV